MRRFLLLLFIAVLLNDIILVAQNHDLILSQTNKSGIYKKGRKISVIAYTPGQAGDSLKIRVLKNNTQILKKATTVIERDSLVVFEGTFSDPCSIIVEVRSKEKNSAIGLLVEPEKLRPGASCPKDFDSFWEKQGEILKALPLDVKTTDVADYEVEKGYSCTDTEINCPGPKPARGYFAKPEKASPGSLPVVILVHAAGVKGSWCRSEPGNAMKYAKMGALCFDLNAHGMLNGQPDNYYEGLEKGELSRYYLQGLTNRDEVYFRGMYLRLLRAIEFMARQPEWDGKRILVMGESQGGGQALVAAGLDKRVSAVVAIVPAMCDWMGSMADRMGGWPQPFESKASKDDMLKTLPYYDAANILKKSKAIIFTEIGLIDMTCPATSVYTAINQAKSRKIIYAVPYRPHQKPEESLAKTWEETVYKPRELFIQDYLR